MAMNNNNQADEPAKDRVIQHHGSLEMLTRVFPFHPKSAVESALESCGGDVAKAVQQLVGHQPPPSSTAPASNEEGTPTSSKSNNMTSGKSAFLPTSSASSFAASSPIRPLYDQMAVPASSPMAMTTTTNNLMAYPSALRMMSSYPSVGMMSFLHPSAYFAAAASAAAAAASPHSYPWLFPGQYGAGVRPLVSQHLCLPGCSVCPISTGTSSASSSPGESGSVCTTKAPGLLMEDLFKSSGRKEMFHHSKP